MNNDYKNYNLVPFRVNITVTTVSRGPELVDPLVDLHNDGWSNPITGDINVNIENKQQGTSKAPVCPTTKPNRPIAGPKNNLSSKKNNGTRKAHTVASNGLNRGNYSVLRRLAKISTTVIVWVTLIYTTCDPS